MAIERDTGARGLRSIIETCLLDIMYEVPSRQDIIKVIIDESIIRGEEKPRIHTSDGRVITLSDAIDSAA